MSNDDFRPNWASAPGDTIMDILHERNLTEDDLARTIDYKLDELKEILFGRTPITLAVARRLESVLGASVEFWMTRDLQYQQDIAKIIVSDEDWINEIPIQDMINFGWIPSVTGLSDRVNTCLRFFDVPSVQKWKELYADVQQMVAFKKSALINTQPGAIAAWLRKGEIEASEIDTIPWDAQRFKVYLPRIRSLTRIKDPHLFIPELKKYCSQSGVAMVVVRAPKGCSVSGAVKFISNDKALLLLSFRYLTDDHFWFSFFHEAGHLLLHGDKGLFLEGEDVLSTDAEEEANEFAADFLIPSEFKSEFLQLHANAIEIIRFSMKIGISPGIVVGQLHHLGIIPHNYLNKLKRHYRWGK